jgi:hypothetical protein
VSHLSLLDVNLNSSFEAPWLMDILLLAWAHSAIQYEEVIFAPSGFSKGPEPATLYEGPPSPEVDARWSELIDGALCLSKYCGK